MNSRTWKEQQQLRREQSVADGVIAAVIIIMMLGLVMLAILARPAQADDDVARAKAAVDRIADLTEEQLARKDRQWTVGDTALQALFLALLAADRGQTAYAAQNRFDVSRNMVHEEVGLARHFIGGRPASGRVNRYFAACAVLHTAVAYALPTPYRTAWQSFWIGVEVQTVDGNVQAGVSVRF